MSDEQEIVSNVDDTIQNQEIESAEEVAVEPETISIKREEWDKLNSIKDSQANLIREKQSQIDRIRHKQQKEQPVSSVTQKEDVVPKPSDFQDEEGYIAALVRHQVEKADVSGIVQQTLQQQHVQEIESGHRKRFAERGVEFARENPDYEVVAFSPEVEVVYENTPGLSELVWSMPNNSEIAYHLGRNTDTLRKIAALPPVYMAGEIARINQQVAPIQTKTVSSAPSPINPLTTGKTATTTTSSNPDDMSMDEYKKWRLKRRS
jgi:hypothetical protein